MSFEPVSQFELDVTTMLPFRKRYQAMTPEQREQELKTVLANTNVKISMSLSENDEYWSGVIDEADRRISFEASATPHRIPVN
jgi:hypothetical protein